MSNPENINVVGKVITRAEKISDGVAIIKLDDGTVITFRTVEHADPMIGSWATLGVDVA